MNKDGFVLIKYHGNYHMSSEKSYLKIQVIDTPEKNPVATFVSSGYPEAQEVRIDLLFLFMTF